VIDQKVAIVTAASKGIGAACARALAQEGFKLVLFSRSEELFDLANELDARPINGSLTNPKDLERLVNFTMEKYERVDAMVINSGHSANKPLLKISDKDWLEGFELLLMPIIRLVRMVMHRKPKHLSVVNISSFGARKPSLKFPVSSVIRAALDAYTQLFVQEFGGQALRMNNVLPGFIDSYAADEQTINQIPMLRQGTTAEVAALAAFLVSDRSSYINGESILIDGGLTKNF
jgi:NAD(P)-dependent dehydrogenase (short-subunit alcohol dehydrogenase family)